MMENPKVLMTIANFGDIEIELYPDAAPISVANFLQLVDNGFYSGLIFHRVIKGFMIQGGGMDKDMHQKAANTIKGEFAANGCKTNNIKHLRGVLSMARTNVADSASSQFFLMHQDSPHLDGQYAAFGKVTRGIEIVDMIANVKTGNVGYYGDVPKEPVVIESVTRV